MEKQQTTTLSRGDVVYSLCGRDGGRIYAVTQVEGEYAYIADGKVRKAGAPKRKKIKHLIPLGAAIRGYCKREEEFGISDPYLRLSLRPYRNYKLEEGLCQRTT